MSILYTINAVGPGHVLNEYRIKSLEDDLRHLRHRMDFRLLLIKFCEREVIDYSITDDCEVICHDERFDEFINTIQRDEYSSTRHQWEDCR
jgi:hypothetical protein